MIRKSIKEEIKQYFLTNPTARKRVRQIESEVKVPLPSAIRYTKELEKGGVILHRLHKPQISRDDRFFCNGLS